MEVLERCDKKGGRQESLSWREGRTTESDTTGRDARRYSEFSTPLGLFRHRHRLNYKVGRPLSSDVYSFPISVPARHEILTSKRRFEQEGRPMTPVANAKLGSYSGGVLQS